MGVEEAEAEEEEADVDDDGVVAWGRASTQCLRLISKTYSVSLGVISSRFDWTIVPVNTPRARPISSEQAVANTPKPF